MRNTRIACIDGLRGVAILSVIFYHAFARWPALVLMPYGQAYARVFGWGWLGVELFFIISGFVICMTLDRCSTFVEFMWKRWLRLFPGMLVASLLIYATAPYINRPLGLPSVSQLLPGLTFIDAKWWALIHGPDSLEGSFWSLYAEMKFYVFAGAAYFTLGRRWVRIGLISGFTGYWLAKALDIGSLTYVAYLFDVSYWAWFACGAFFYEWQRSGSQLQFFAALVVGAIASVAPVPGVADIPNMEFAPLLGFPFVLLFAGALAIPVIQRSLSNRFLVFVGFTSYPLYLIHEHALVGLIQLLGLKSPVAVVLPISTLLVVAWLIARFGEPLIRRLIAVPSMIRRQRIAAMPSPN